VGPSSPSRSSACLPQPGGDRNRLNDIPLIQGVTLSFTLIVIS
jgi:hypothetical protein